MVRQIYREFKIYTKKGDKGFTSLFNGKKVAKDNLRIKALGEVDEVNSLIGLVNSFLKDKKIKQELIKIQQDLFLAGGYLAGSLKTEIKILKKRTEELELLIDSLAKQTPELKNFILPGGTNSASLLHFSRTVCRRAERNIVSLSKKEKIDNVVVVYLNRLSDTFFTMARFVNFKQGEKEEVWKIK